MVMAKKEMTPYTPPVVRTRKEWQTTIRKQRRVYYETLPEAERGEFLRHILKIRNKGDYQSFNFFKKLFPTFFKDA